MAIREPEAAARRAPLTRERVLRVAIDLADRDGINGLSMRRLGQELRVDPMALYRHVRNKDDLFDGAVNLLIGEIERPTAGPDWLAALRDLLMESRAVMLRHPWARRVLEERGTTGIAAMAHIESVLETLLRAGFSLEMAHHALHVLDSRIFGFSPAIFDDTARPAPSPEVAAAMAQAMPGFPRISELARSVSHEGVLGACDDDVEFAFGVDLILAGLGRLRGA